MRTTITLDEDVADKALEVSHRLRRPFKYVVNAALRVGLGKVERPGAGRAYRTKPRLLGLRRGLSLDNIQDILTRVEGEAYR